MDYYTFIIRILLALGCGILIGLERQIHNKNAGSQTNALVAVGAAMFVTLSFNLEILNGDVTRIIAQVVTGIGFLGAGVIIQRGTDVSGLTTAATIWVSSAVGCLAGAGYIAEAIFCTGIIVLLNFIFHRINIANNKENEGTSAREENSPPLEKEKRGF